MEGQGVYDDLCTLVREQAEAQGALVLVLGGNKGEGFSAQFTSPELTAYVPAMLRFMADQIESGAEGEPTASHPPARS